MPNEPRQAFGAERVPLHDSLNKGPEEDDDMVGLRVDLHRLRIQDAIPASVDLSLIHISEPTRRLMASRMPSSA